MAFPVIAKILFHLHIVKIYAQISKDNAVMSDLNSKDGQNLANLVNSSGSCFQMHTEQRMALQSNNINLLKNGKQVFCD